MNSVYSGRTYTKFDKHADGINEPIKAENTNQIQSAVQGVQRDNVEIRDDQFIQYSHSQLTNSTYANAMFNDPLKTKEYIDFNISTNIEFSGEQSCVFIPDIEPNMTIFTIPIKSSIEEKEPVMNDFAVLIDADIPIGCDILCHILNDKDEIFPVKINSDKKPLHLMDYTTSVRVKFEVKKNTSGETPRLFGFTVLYFDLAVELSYGLINPDLSRFDSQSYGLTVLIRDKYQDYRLVKVIEPDRKTDLTYREFVNGDVELSIVDTSFDDGLQMRETLNYEDVIIDTRLRAINRTGVPSSDLTEVIIGQQNSRFYIRTEAGMEFASRPLTAYESNANNKNVIIYQGTADECMIVNMRRVRTSVNYPTDFTYYDTYDDIPDMYVKEPTRWLRSILTEKTREFDKFNTGYDYATIN